MVRLVVVCEISGVRFKDERKVETLEKAKEFAEKSLLAFIYDGDVVHHYCSYLDKEDRWSLFDKDLLPQN